MSVKNVRIWILRRLRTAETRSEAAAFVILGMTCIALFAYAAGYARREYRDGLRRQYVREMKSELERSFNTVNGFPLHPSGDLGWCGSTEDPEDWFFTAFLKRERRWSSALYTPAQQNGIFRYCPTAVGGKTTTGRPLAAGFFLEAALENRDPDTGGFNTEYNMFERTLTESGHTVFRVCGGTEAQCGTER
ncbi:MAG: hypothetical protein G01um1014106_483 [Parcubacteria group bacterium Gr01-1014_106]|nr:MAG: hypothetical protein G01um1014106_483 [Parcubacteria group bacterium Gr01-1014_106]